MTYERSLETFRLVFLWTSNGNQFMRMIEVQILANQTESVYEWTNKLINSIPFEKWDVMPDIHSHNYMLASWTTYYESFIFNSIMVIIGHQMNVLKQGFCEGL